MTPKSSHRAPRLRSWLGVVAAVVLLPGCSGPELGPDPDDEPLSGTPLGWSFRPAAFAVDAPGGCACDVAVVSASGDTVCAYSDVVWSWENLDADGRITGWQSRFDDEAEWTLHPLGDTDRRRDRLSPGTRTLEVAALAVGNENLTSIRTFTLEIAEAELDPPSLLSIEAAVARPWISLTDTLRTFPASGDTVPFGARLTLDWASAGCDSLVGAYYWQVGFEQGTTDLLSVETPALLYTNTTELVPIFVRVLDPDGIVTASSDTTWIWVNYSPTGEWTDCPTSIPAGVTRRFDYTVGDIDSDALAEMVVQYRFDEEIWSSPETITGGAGSVFRTFSPAEAGQTHELRIRALDQSGLARPSAEVLCEFFVSP